MKHRAVINININRPSLLSVFNVVWSRSGVRPSVRPLKQREGNDAVFSLYSVTFDIFSSVRSDSLTESISAAAAGKTILLAEKRAAAVRNQEELHVHGPLPLLHA